MVSLTVIVVASCGGASTAGVETTVVDEWSLADSFDIPDITDEVVMTAGVVRDGRYWAVASPETSPEGVMFDVSRVRFGEVCEQWAVEQGRGDIGCLNDYAVDDTVTASVASSDVMTVTVVSVANQAARFTITRSELIRLLTGSATAAPRDFEFAPFPFVVTVKDGVVMTADQVWVP